MIHAKVRAFTTKDGGEQLPIHCCCCRLPIFYDDIDILHRHCANMGKAEAGSAKAVANAIKAKGEFGNRGGKRVELEERS